MVIVCGGSNDVNRDLSHIGLNSLEKFGNLRTNTKILILALQPRHDLVQDSDGYTRRGQHFHSTGKSKVVQYIVQYLTKYSTNSNSVSIPLKWKTSTSDTTDTNNNISDLEMMRMKKISLLLVTKTSEHGIEGRSFHLLEVMIFYGNKSRQCT